MLSTYIVRGVVLAMLYFEVTKANDTTVRNIFVFVAFYLLLVAGAIIAGIDTNVITSAFLTKCVFTLVDTQIKKTDEPK
ncbi:hypothetical protein EBZ38_04240 [bacterium]|nr:hypothetical protein [bacterium]